MPLPRSLPTGFTLPTNAHICILRLSAIGDVCHAVSVVARIRRHRPDISIVWVVGKIEYGLLTGMEGVKFVVYDKKAGKKGKENLKRDLANQKFDALCVMQVALRANWLSTAIKADIKLGFDRRHSKEGHSLFINKRIGKLTHPHVLEGFHGFADALGIPRDRDLHWPITVPDEDRQFVANFISELGKFIIVCPAASKLERCWLPERYADIIKACRDMGYTVLLCGGPSPLDKQCEQAIQACLDFEITSLIGKTSLKKLFLLLSFAELVISPDTGPAHMATAAGTPVIGLYAHSNPRRTGPYLSQHLVINAYDAHIQNQTNKPWQDLKWGTRAKGENLMAAITVEAVKEKIALCLPKLTS